MVPMGRLGWKKRKREEREIDTEEHLVRKEKTKHFLNKIRQWSNLEKRSGSADGTEAGVKVR